MSSNPTILNIGQEEQDTYLVIKKPDSVDNFEVDFENQEYFLTNRHKTKPIIEIVQSISSAFNIKTKESLIIPHEDSLEIVPFFIFRKVFNNRLYFLTFKYGSDSNISNAKLFQEKEPVSKQDMKSIFVADRIWNVDIKKSLEENFINHVYESLRNFVVLSDINTWKIEDLVKEIDITITPSPNENTIKNSILGLGFIVDLSEHYYDVKSLKHMSPEWEEVFTIKTELVFDNMLKDSNKSDTVKFTYDYWSNRISKTIF